MYNIKCDRQLDSSSNGEGAASFCLQTVHRTTFISVVLLGDITVGCPAQNR